MRYDSKPSLLEDIDLQWDLLWQEVDSIDLNRLDSSQLAAYIADPTPVAPTDKPSIEWTLREVLAHLHGWHRLLVTWIDDAAKGRVPHTPSPGFNWAQTKALNRKIANELCEYDFRQLRRKLKASHRRVMNRILPLSSSDLIQPGRFEWTGKNSLVSYVGPNTAGHYRWAIKKIKLIWRNH